MPKPMMITFRRKHLGRVEVAQEVTHEDTGLMLLKELWKDNKFDTVALVKVDMKNANPAKRFKVIAKIDRNCKHIGSLQHRFVFENSASVLGCEKCDLVYEEVPINV